MLHRITLAALLLLWAALAIPAHASTPGSVRSPLSGWKFTEPVVEGYGPIRTTYRIEEDTFSMRPNAETPHRSFGWLEGPRFTVPPAVDQLEGNVAGMIITFTFPKDYSGLAPELRARINTSNFAQYSSAGIPAGRFNELRPQGWGTLTVVFDRRNLAANDELRLFIDLFSHYEPGQVDPDFWVRIEKVELFISGANSSFRRGDLISAAYMLSNRDVYVHAGGSTERRRIHINAGAYAYDGAFALVIRNRNLYAYSTLDNFASHFVHGSDVVSAAISDNHIIFVTINGHAYYYNSITHEKRHLAHNSNFFTTTSSGDGMLLVAEVSGHGTARFHGYDTRSPLPTLQMLWGNFDVAAFHSRDTGRENTGKSDTKGHEAGWEWTLFP